MASRLLRGVGALAAQALRAHGPRGAAVTRSMASGGGVPTDEEQATGLEREIMIAAQKGLSTLVSFRTHTICYLQRQLQAPRKTLI
uniref:Cytochrome c oxidase subunit 5B n=1 Tax=Mus musculus TaxID=10090 RepID=F7C106_MOUSE